MPSSEDKKTVNATAAAIAPAATDREAHFALFVAGHRDQAVRLAWRLTGGDQATAEEVAQADVQSVAGIDGIDLERAPAIVESAREHVE